MSDTSRKGVFAQWLRDNAAMVIFALVMILLLLCIAAIFVPYFGRGTEHRTLLMALADPSTARGLITFLVALGTVGIAVSAVVYVATTAVIGDELKNRYGYVKEILTSLIGILGTIIGFYFGATQAQTAATSVMLNNLSLTPLIPVAGKPVELKGSLSGGHPPYSYQIQFSQDKIKPIDGASSDGVIDQTIPLDGYDPSKPLAITVKGGDANDASTGSNQIALPGSVAPVPPAASAAH